MSQLIFSFQLWWKWLTLIVFLAMLLSIPWEFMRMYQSMVAEKVSQMQSVSQEFDTGWVAIENILNNRQKWIKIIARNSVFDC